MDARKAPLLIGKRRISNRFASLLGACSDFSDLNVSISGDCGYGLGHVRFFTFVDAIRLTELRKLLNEK